jgi:hypothetical protein
MKINKEDIKKINAKIRRDESCILRRELNLGNMIYTSKKIYSRKTKHKNNEKSI